MPPFLRREPSTLDGDKVIQAIMQRVGRLGKNVRASIQGRNIVISGEVERYDVKQQIRFLALDFIKDGRTLIDEINVNAVGG